MILFKKWARHKVKSYIYYVNQFLRVKPIKNEIKNVNKKSRMFTFCNIFDLFTSRTQKIVSWPLVFKPDLHIFPYNKQLRKIWGNFIDKFLLYHTSLIFFIYKTFLWQRVHNLIVPNLEKICYDTLSIPTL